MGCTKIGHCHQWPTSGTLVIQRCEIRCNFCDGDQAKKDWKYAWFLRRHVRAVHVKREKYPNLEVDVGWDENAPKGTKENPRAATKKGGVTVKSEYSSAFVQPLDNGQRYGPLPGAFGATVNDRTISPNDFTGFGIGPYAMSVSAIAFRTEDAALLETHRANTMDDFEGWLNYLVDTADMGSYANGNTGMLGPDSLEGTVNPTLTQHNGDATNQEDSAIDLTADEDDIVVSPERQHKHKRSNSDLAAAKFFMSDYESLSEDAIDEMPLANVFNNHIFNEHPDFDEYWDLFSENVNKTTEQMRVEGIDVEAVQHMIPAVTLFARSLQECK